MDVFSRVRCDEAVLVLREWLIVVIWHMKVSQGGSEPQGIMRMAALVSFWLGIMPASILFQGIEEA